MKKYYYFFLLLVLSSPVMARSPISYSGNSADSAKGLKIGDHVPDILISHIVNYSKSEVRLSNFKGKLLILDFWATWCSPCVAMIPTMDSLQSEFNGKVQFLPVSYQTEKVVLPFLDRLGKRKPAHLPDVLEDNILSKLFPHTYLPHYVWIDASGKVVAITEYKDVNAANIKAMLTGAASHLEVKLDDENVPYDPAKPLFFDNNGGNGNTITYHSFFGNYIAGLSTAYYIYKRDTAKGVRIVATNAIIPMLYQVAYSNRAFFGNNRTVYEVKDTSELFVHLKGDASIAWMKRNHAFNYELSVPPSLSTKAFDFMQQDLDRLFPQYTARVEKRKRSVLVLSRTKQSDVLKSAGGEPSFHFDGTQGTLQNCSIKLLVGQLNVIYLQYLPTPVIDETGYTGNVDLEIQANMSNVGEINDALAAYDLKLVPGTRDIDVLVISDNAK